MGPLFNAVLVLAALTAIFLSAFVTFRLIHKTPMAILWGILFAAGAAAGASSVVLMTFLFGIRTLDSTLGVVGYLGFLVVGGLAGGASAIILYMRFRKSPMTA